jgi:hypothetical protein
LVTDSVADGERLTLRVTDEDRLTLRDPEGVFVGVRLLENRLGRRVGSLGGSVGSSVGRGGSSVLGSSVKSVGSSVIIRAISVIIRSGILGYSVTGIVGSSIMLG